MLRGHSTTCATGGGVGAPAARGGVGLEALLPTIVAALASEHLAEDGSPALRAALSRAVAATIDAAVIARPGAGSAAVARDTEQRRLHQAGAAEQARRLHRSFTMAAAACSLTPCRAGPSRLTTQPSTRCSSPCSPAVSTGPQKKSWRAQSSDLPRHWGTGAPPTSFQLPRNDSCRRGGVDRPRARPPPLRHAPAAGPCVAVRPLCVRGRCAPPRSRRRVRHLARARHRAAGALRLVHPRAGRGGGGRRVRKRRRAWCSAPQARRGAACIVDGAAGARPRPQRRLYSHGRRPDAPRFGRRHRRR